VNFGRILGLVSGCHLTELFVDLAGAVAGIGELGGLWKWLAEVVTGVGDLAAGSFDAGEGVLLASLKVVEAVFQPGDQPGGVSGVQVTGGELDCAAGHAVEDDGDCRFTEGPFDGGGQREAAERTRVDVPAAHAIEFADLSSQHLFEMLASLGPLGVVAAVDGYGEGVTAGVVQPGDRDVDVTGQLAQVPDVGLVAFDGVLQRGLVAVVGTLGALEPGEGSVGFGFVHQQRVAGGQGLDFAESRVEPPHRR
jgi:hypothetical protein